MKSSASAILALLVCFVISSVLCQQKPKEFKVGEPQFSLQGQGSGKNHLNFQAEFNAGVGTKVWESRNKQRSVDVGVNYGQGFQRMDGHTFKSKPNYGIGATFRWGKK